MTSEAPWETDVNTFVKEMGFEGKDPDGETDATACKPPPTLRTILAMFGEPGGTRVWTAAQQGPRPVGSLV